MLIQTSLHKDPRFLSVVVKLIFVWVSSVPRLWSKMTVFFYVLHHDDDDDDDCDVSSSSLWHTHVCKKIGVISIIKFSVYNRCPKKFLNRIKESWALALLSGCWLKFLVNYTIRLCQSCWFQTQAHNKPGF